MMTNKSEQRIKKWLREGKWTFILKRGILQWGVIYSAIMYYFSVGLVFDLEAFIMWLVLGEDGLRTWICYVVVL